MEPGSNFSLTNLHKIIPERVWDVVEKDIPELIRLIEPLVPPDESDEIKN